MKTVTYTLRDRAEELLDTLTVSIPARWAPVATMLASATLATAARRIGLERLAARLAWHAYDVADCGLGNDWAFTGLLPNVLPWCYPDRENRPGWFLPVMTQA
jgi:hypothetical protein